MGVNLSLEENSDSVPWRVGEVEDIDDSYVAQHDFFPTRPDQLQMRKGERFHVLSLNSSRDWCEIESDDDGRRGWVPKSYINPATSLEVHDWYHGDVGRAETSVLLGNRDGNYLVRKGVAQAGTWALSVVIDGKVEHFRISNDFDGKFYIERDHKFASLLQLVTYYQQQQPGLRVWLGRPAEKKTKPAMYSLSQDYDEWEIDRDEFEILDFLGQGSFGEVMKARWKKYGTSVAIKRLVGQFYIDREREFHTEADNMKSLKNPHLIQLLGISTSEDPYLLISEFMCNGDLAQYLRRHDENSMTWSILLYMAVQVGMGMEYLEERGVVHRDLAARNCFVGDDNLIKVGDFGLSRPTGPGQIYQGGEACLFPYKWTAPEGIMHQQFTSKSDVWSFGVLLWEIATLAKFTPYEGIPDVILAFQLMNNVRLECPENCPTQLYELMESCWLLDPDDRPVFSVIRAKLNSISDFIRNAENIVKMLQNLLRNSGSSQ